MTKELKAFLEDLATLLEKHKGSIEVMEQYHDLTISFEVGGNRKSVEQPGGFIDFEAHTIRELLKKR